MEEYMEEYNELIKEINRISSDDEIIEMMVEVLEKKYKEIVKKDKRLNRQFKILIKRDKEIEEKNKMIDLMLEFLENIDLGYYVKEDGGEILGLMRQYNKEDWKDYFKKLSKQKNNIKEK